MFEEEEEFIEEEQFIEEREEEAREEEVSEPEERKPSRASRVIAKLRSELGKEAAAVVSQQVSSGSGSVSSNNSQGSTGVTSNGGSQGSTGVLVNSDTSGDSTYLEQQEQTTGQTEISFGSTESVGPAVSAFEVAEQQQEQPAQTDMTFESGSESFGGSSVEFENTFNDAIGTGQSIGQFLSNEVPNFAKFDVAPPTVSEQRTTKAVENLAERLGEEAAMENLQAQLESGEDGSERNETIAVAVIGYKAGFSAYTGMEQLTDQQDWYQVKALYTNAKIDDNKYSLYMMAGKSDKKMQEMVLQQYKQE